METRRYVTKQGFEIDAMPYDPDKARKGISLPAHPGDMLIRNSKGGWDPCDPETFRKTYSSKPA